MSRFTCLLLFSALASLVAGSVSAQLYRWVDAEGRVHFSDQPRSGSDEIEVEADLIQSVVESPRAADEATPPARSVVAPSATKGADEDVPSATESADEDTLPEALRRRLERARNAPASGPGRQAEIDAKADAIEAHRRRQEAEALRDDVLTTREKRDIRAERNRRRRRGY